MRILLVEDNPVNQTVALRILEKKGHRVSLARDGSEALKELEKKEYHGFDLILMDVQMPVMDGLTATKIIRDKQAPLGLHSPIVGLTAHASAADRERCHSAGMDGYLSKPFDPSELHNLIDRMTRDQGAASTLAVSPAPQECPAADADQTNIDRANTRADNTGDGPTKEMILRRFDDDESLFNEALDIFVQQYPAQLSAIRSAIESGNGPDLERAAHGLKGSLGIFGAVDAFEIASRMEIMGSSGSLDAAAAYWVKIKSATVLLHTRLENLRVEMFTEATQ